jgi:hypothetical protein
MRVNQAAGWRSSILLILVLLIGATLLYLQLSDTFVSQMLRLAAWIVFVCSIIYSAYLVWYTLHIYEINLITLPSTWLMLLVSISRVSVFLMMPGEIPACWLCLGDWR